MSGPPRPAEPPPPYSGTLLPLMFIGLVALVVCGTLLVFFPGGLIVMIVLAAVIGSQYFIWGRWLRKAIEAEEAADAELDSRDRNGSL